MLHAAGCSGPQHASLRTRSCPAPPPPPHPGPSQHEAAFLLWHHALQGEEECEALLSAGLLPACLPLLEPQEVPLAEKRCAAGGWAGRLQGGAQGGRAAPAASTGASQRHCHTAWPGHLPYRAPLLSTPTWAQLA